MLSSSILFPVCKKKKREKESFKMCQCVIAAVEMMIKAAQGQVVFLSDTHSITIDDHRRSQNNQLRRWSDTWTLEGKEVMNKRKFVSETVCFHFVLKQRPEPLMCQLLHHYTQASKQRASTTTATRRFVQRKVQIFRDFVNTETFSTNKHTEGSKQKRYVCVFWPYVAGFSITLLSRCCADTLVGFRHKQHLVRLRKTLRVWL